MICLIFFIVMCPDSHIPVFLTVFLKLATVTTCHLGRHVRILVSKDPRMWRRSRVIMKITKSNEFFPIKHLKWFFLNFFLVSKNSCMPLKKDFKYLFLMQWCNQKSLIFIHVWQLSPVHLSPRSMKYIKEIELLSYREVTEECFSAANCIATLLRIHFTNCNL